MPADLTGFESEFLVRLKTARLLFVSEIVKLGEAHGLSEEQVERVLEHAERSGLGFSETVFVYSEAENHG